MKLSGLDNVKINAYVESKLKFILIMCSCKSNRSKKFHIKYKFKVKSYITTLFRVYSKFFISYD